MKLKSLSTLFLTGLLFFNSQMPALADLIEATGTYTGGTFHISGNVSSIPNGTHVCALIYNNAFVNSENSYVPCDVTNGIVSWTSTGNVNATTTYLFQVCLSDSTKCDADYTFIFTQANNPTEALNHVADQIQNLINEDPGTPLADKLEDAYSKTQAAQAALAQQPPDTQKALGEIEGAVGELEAAVKDSLLDTTTGNDFMQQLSGIARQLAVDAIEQAIDDGGSPTVIQDAEDYFHQAEQLRSIGAYKEAVNKYKDALAKAESA